MISLQAELPDKEHGNVQHACCFPAENQGFSQIRDIVRHGR
jgi:hypothetical protein